VLTVIFVEVLRLILVLLAALAGVEIGHSLAPAHGGVVGLVIGALIGYVLGGVIGRLIAREEHRAVDSFSKVAPGELFAGTITGTAGILLGVALCLPFLAIWRSPLVYPIATSVAWVFAWIGFKIGAAKGRQVVAAAGLSRILAPPSDPPAGYALLVDTSSVMDRSLMVFGRAGLLMGGIVIPRFVIDQVKTLADSPDPVASRRARRGLESLEALREIGVTVHIAENELPEIDNLEDRIIEIGRRLGLRLATCSNHLLDNAKRRGTDAIDLRKIGSELTPDYPQGEKLIVDLIKPGNQARQAVGYLPDGDMVVVNDASHMIGRENVLVEVLSTRTTPQGVLVFAHLPARQVETARDLTTIDSRGFDRSRQERDHDRQRGTEHPDQRSKPPTEP
jgi:uncharacterized protein YacL